MLRTAPASWLTLLAAAGLLLVGCGSARQDAPITPSSSQLDRWLAAESEHRLLLVEATYERVEEELTLEIRRVAVVSGDLAPSVGPPGRDLGGRAELLDASGRILRSVPYPPGAPSSSFVGETLRLRLPALQSARRVRLVEAERKLEAEAEIEFHQQTVGAEPHGPLDRGQRVMQTYYLEIVTEEVDAVCAAYASANGVEFGEPDAALGNARTAALAGGGLVGVRAPLRETEEPVVRPYWLVDDIEAALAAAVEAGGVVAHPPLEIPGYGTFAIYFHGGVQHGLWQR